MSTVSIRRAEPADAILLAELAADTFPLACPPGTSETNIALFIDQHLSPSAFSRYLGAPTHRLWIAEIDTDKAGYAMAVYGEPTDSAVAGAITRRPTVELSKLYVHARHHGAGVATLLLEEVVLDARQAGCRSVWLGVNQENARANRFYEKSGFRVVGTKHFQVGDSLESDFVREKIL